MKLSELIAQLSTIRRRNELLDMDVNVREQEEDVQSTDKYADWPIKEVVVEDGKVIVEW